MKLTGHTILITGGSEGIGFSMAQRLAPNNKVIICGRSEHKLARAKELCSDLYTQTCDVTNETQRRAMVERVLGLYPQLNILINNAGAKQYADVLGNGPGYGTQFYSTCGAMHRTPAAPSITS